MRDGVPSPSIVRTPDALARIPARSRGLVPTMGALHAGHQALIARAAAENDEVVVSIFVNPTQFNDPNDLAKYPRTPERDLALAAEAGATIVYMPDAATIYPEGHATTVQVSGLTARWEGAFRPGHFDGVTTVVSILLDHVQPDHSYFGEKDFQQLAVVRRMHRDLHLPGEIVGCPIVREASGLALSSRNARLKPEDIPSALRLSRSLAAMTEAVASGESSVETLIAIGMDRLSDFERVDTRSTPTDVRRLFRGSEPTKVQVEYLAIVDPETLEPVTDVADGSRALVAARVGGIRLIDTHDLRTPFPAWRDAR